MQNADPPKLQNASVTPIAVVDFHYPAGSTATVLCYPLDVIRTRMLSGRGNIYSSATKTVKAMLRDESLASFYVGCVPAVLSTAASGAIFYGVYDILKTQYISSERLSRQCQSVSSDEVVMGAGRTMLYGALAGAAAESILYPLEVLRRRFVFSAVRNTSQHMQDLTMDTSCEMIISCFARSQ